MTKEKILKANKAGLNNDFTSWWSPVLQAAHSWGLKGVDLSQCPVVKGYRYGKAPDGFISQNYVENTSESGLSLAWIEDGEKAGSSMWFSDRDIFEYEGVLLPSTGSDGEPLILAFDAEDWD